MSIQHAIYVRYQCRT